MSPKSASSTIFSSEEFNNDWWILPLPEMTPQNRVHGQHYSMQCSAVLTEAAIPIWDKSSHCRWAHRGVPTWEVSEQFCSVRLSFSVSAVFAGSPTKSMRSAHHDNVISLSYTDENVSRVFLTHTLLLFKYKTVLFKKLHSYFKNFQL